MFTRAQLVEKVEQLVLDEARALDEAERLCDEAERLRDAAALTWNPWKSARLELEAARLDDEAVRLDEYADGLRIEREEAEAALWNATMFPAPPARPEHRAAPLPRLYRTVVVAPPIRDGRARRGTSRARRRSTARGRPQKARAPGSRSDDDPHRLVEPRHAGRLGVRRCA
jgi:hypothetical protein